MIEYINVFFLHAQKSRSLIDILHVHEDYKHPF